MRERRSVLSVAWGSSMRPEIDPQKPRAKDTAVFVLRKDETSQTWDSPADRSAYMPGNHYSMAIVNGLSDPEIGAVLKAIQKLRAEPEATLRTSR